MRIIELSPNEKIEICDKCYTAFAYTKEDTSIYYTEWQDTRAEGSTIGNTEMRFKHWNTICPKCGKKIHLTATTQLRKKGSKLYDND